jgi:DNA-directed RNA polymerase alpha subunit
MEDIKALNSRINILEIDISKISWELTCIKELHDFLYNKIHELEMKIINLGVSEHLKNEQMPCDINGKPIDELNLPYRIENILKSEGIHAIGELAKKTEIELLKIPGLGRKSLQEIINSLALKGVSLYVFLRDCI